MDDDVIERRSPGKVSMPRRIVVKGTSGAGKSTFAAELAQRLDLTYIELDALHHGPNWSAPPAEEFRIRVRGAMAAALRGWVIDGNYDSKLGETVVGAADTIVWLDLPLGVKLRRLWRRTTHRIRHGAELWNGNRETWRGAFVGRESLFMWTLRSHVRHRRQWPSRFRHDHRFVRIRSVGEARCWLDCTPSRPNESSERPSPE
jgi:adenylate kinase family enzyme